MYAFWVFVHLIGVLGFVATHGVSMGVLFKLRGERDPRRINDLVALSGSSVMWMYGALGVLLLGGIVAGFMGHWWSRGWIWASIGVLVLTSVLMYAVARPYYRRVGLVARAMAGGSEAVSEDQLRGIVRSGRSWAIAAIGFVGLLSILYMMVFKPALGLSPAPPPVAACSPAGTAVEVVAQGLAFDADCLAAPAGTAFTLVMDNRDAGVPHNVAIYTDASLGEPLFVGDLESGPIRVEYEVPALPAGDHYFRCDAHPAMQGTFVAEQTG